MAASALCAQTSSPIAAGPAPRAEATPLSAIDSLLERLPDLLDFDLPGLDPKGALRFYAHPRFGDLLRRDYLRLPVGARFKVSERVELDSELESYFTHGLSDSAGYGLSKIRFGGAYERPACFDGQTLVSTGLSLIAPLGRPPAELSDGHNHLSPFVAVSRPLPSQWLTRATGFANLSADLLDRSEVPGKFGRNQLHANSLNLVVGVVREWSRFQGTLAVSYATSALTSDENRHVVALRPGIIVPITRREDARTRLTLNLGGRAVWGPEGQEFGVSSSVRVEFNLLRGISKPGDNN